MQRLLVSVVLGPVVVVLIALFAGIIARVDCMKRAHVVLLGWLLLGVPTARSQQPVFRVTTDLVSVDVLATSRGQPLTGLTAANFEVRDNGVVQKIDSVSVEQVPLDVVLVFDTSESMAGDRIEQLMEAGRNVLERLRPGDRAALVTFSERTVIRHALSSDRASVRRVLDGLDANGRTSMFDALYVGLMLRRTGATRSMLLLFSDGRDNASWLGLNDVVQVARESDVVLYAVGLDPGVRDQLRGLAEETGGDLMVADSTRELATLFVRMLREMQARYVLTYYPKGVKREGWHALDVRLVGKKGEIKARRGYYVPPA